MNIVVCMKQVPDTELKIEVKNGKVDLEDIKFVINPFDEYAIEEALRIREKFGGKITVFCVGPERVKEALRGALAFGVDEAIHIKDEIFEDADPYSVALILKKALEKVDFDLVICGKEGADFDMGQTGIALAEMLGIPHVRAVVNQEILNGKIKCKRVIEGGHEIVEAPLPALFTTAQGLNEPRYPSLKGIMMARKKEIPEWSSKDLGIDSLEKRIEYVEFLKPEERKAGRILEGSREEVVKELVKILREEVKVI